MLDFTCDLGTVFEFCGVLNVKHVMPRLGKHPVGVRVGCVVNRYTMLIFGRIQQNLGAGQRLGEDTEPRALRHAAGHNVQGYAAVESAVVHILGAVPGPRQPAHLGLRKPVKRGSDRSNKVEFGRVHVLVAAAAGTITNGPHHGIQRAHHRVRIYESAIVFEPQFQPVITQLCLKVQVPVADFIAAVDLPRLAGWHGGGRLRCGVLRALCIPIS